jgi:hypothetical protein
MKHLRAAYGEAWPTTDEPWHIELRNGLNNVVATYSYNHQGAMRLYNENMSGNPITIFAGWTINIKYRQGTNWAVDSTSAGYTVTIEVVQ